MDIPVLVDDTMYISSTDQLHLINKAVLSASILSSRNSLMPVCKIIFRLDLRRLNFDIMDNPGRVLRLMHELGENFWSDFRDASQDRALTAIFRNKSQSQFRRLNVGVKNLYFVIEEAQGIELAKLELNESYLTIFKGIQALHEEFHLNELSRAGLRLIYLGSIAGNAPDLRPTFKQLIDGSLVEKVQSLLGQPADYGINVDGSDGDKILYHFKIGPYQQEEGRRHFNETHEQVRQQQTGNFICDLDLYEENFALKGTTRPINWTRPLVIKAQKLIKGVEELISTRL